MAYLTFDYLNQYGNRLKARFELRRFEESSAPNKRRIFLSQRHSDRDIVEKVVGFLQELGSDVYVDYLDDLLPNKTDFETAKILRDRIKSCAKFILLATPNSSESKWIPWELGLGDRKGLTNVAILPLVSNEDYWKEKEYYQIYGSIKLSRQGNWCFFPPNQTNGTKLKKWLTNKSLLLE